MAGGEFKVLGKRKERVEERERKQTVKEKLKKLAENPVAAKKAKAICEKGYHEWTKFGFHSATGKQRHKCTRCGTLTTNLN